MLATIDEGVDHRLHSIRYAISSVYMHCILKHEATVESGRVLDLYMSI